MFKKIFIVVIAVLWYGSAFAEEKTASLEEIVVTATRTEKELASAPGSVSVVTKEDIEKRNIKTVDDALNTTAGIYQKRGKGIMDIMSAITLRGIPAQQRTLILMDGITLNDPYSGGVYFDGMAVEDVEKIEVVKGPFSSLYGGYAMGGVVNIITKMPEKREFTFKTGYGSSWDRGEAMDDLRKFYLSYGDRLKDQLSLFLSYGYKATNGYPSDFNVQSSKPTAGITGWSYTTDTQGNTRYLIGDKGDNRWWDDQITLKAGYDFTKETKMNLSYMRNSYEYNYDDPHTYLKNAAGSEVWSYGSVKESSFLSGSGGRLQNIYGIGFETRLSSAEIKLSLGLADQGESWYVTAGGATSSTIRTGGPGTLSETPSQSYNADIQFTVPVFDRHILTFGGTFRHGWADSQEHGITNWKDETSKTTLSYQAKGKDKTYALFVQDEIMILKNLTAYIGFRQDRWETYDGYVNQVGTAGYPNEYDSRNASAFSPKAAVVYKPFYKTTFRTSIGKAFRPPTIYELYRTWTPSKVTYAGNPELKPETTTSWDIGIEQGFWRGAKGKATYFENYLKDLIYSKTVSSTLQEKINAGKAESKGVELEAEQRFDKWLRLFANFTYTDAKIKENEAKPSTEGKRLTDVPERMFNIGGDFEKGPFSASLTGRYMSKRYSNDDNTDIVNGVYTSYDPYFVTDAKVSYKFTKNATLSFSVDNIFDRDYFAYYKAAGRSWFGEVTLRF